MLNIERSTFVASAFYALQLWSQPGLAADTAFSAKPMTIVVQYPAGGVADVIARDFGQAITAKTGQPVIVVNKPGAGGAIAATTTAQSAADGYTILFPGIAIGTQSVTDPDLAEKFMQTLTPVAEIVRGALMCATTPQVPAKTVAELVEFAKKAPKPIFYGTSGIGGTPHFAIEFLKGITGMPAVHVPFPGAPAVVTAALQGEVQFLCEAPVLIKQFVDQKKLVTLAATGTFRDPLFPDVPTMKEAGYPSFDFGVALGFFAPIKTPAPVLGKLNELLVSVATDPEAMKRITAMGYVSTGTTRQNFVSYVNNDIEKFKKIASDQNLKFEK